MTARRLFGVGALASFVTGAPLATACFTGSPTSGATSADGSAQTPDAIALSDGSEPADALGDAADASGPPPFVPACDGSAPGFAVDVLGNAFSSCGASGCHLASIAAGGLDLRPALAYGNLVNVPAMNVTSPMLRVAPGDPDASFLWQKVANAMGPVEGAPMPPFEPWTPLPSDQLNAVYCWIAAGAPND